MFSFGRFAVTAVLVATAMCVVNNAARAGWERERYITTLESTDAQRIVNSINAGEVTNWRNASVVNDTSPGPNARFHVFAEHFTPDPVNPGNPTNPSNPAQPGTTLNGNLAPGAASRGVSRHIVALTPGRRYTIELQSGSGATRDVGGQRVAQAGFFDTVLLVEDDQGRQIPGGFNDDIAWPRNSNSRVSIVAPTNGTARIVVSSFRTGESGPYTIQIRPE